MTATATFDAALVQDAAAALGISAGNVTIAGAVIFINVAAGSFTTDVAPPAGLSCSIFPEGGASLPLTSVGGTLMHVGYSCSAT